ncbi:hypothetical protein ACWT_6605 [Actinoplanes sp. SE50]|uniref:PLD nuclease N-terminal domain-containing protein n=1 Tax=unclassified Actinoplanes TaxID=2626549 RepID=UPI00023EC6D6|nr:MULTISPECIES: PLD nuclease N-terminal domain-containing protein [unclassified Actinoplanes]AEV87617.1 hypothetical protein ACPL_6735 [Actinoplanes sp. SE50/110]ATO86020.1 hypothetical protein ACWT_6605 [Actinoplanes sp. SE50]SLM03434.1 hypothetical protein ACSP50_6723 [Actinoplanes sp. SE50/110]
MARVNTLLFLLAVALVVVALIDCLLTAPARLRHFPRAAWLVLILCCPVAGAIAWFRAGRRQNAGQGEGLAGHESAGRGEKPIGPEDDPEFIRLLAAAIREG